MVPPEAPLAGDVDFALLAQRFKLSGGAIRNCTLAAAFLAAEEGSTIDMAHLVRAVGTKQDFDQSLSLVSMPVSLALQEISVKPDPAKAKSAAAKLGPAVSALQVMAGSKKEAKNKANMPLPVADIQSAQTTLQVLGDFTNAHKIWTEAFLAAMQAIDAAIALPVIDPDAAKDADKADPPPPTPSRRATTT
jgi:hypothetical protein